MNFEVILDVADWLFGFAGNPITKGVLAVLSLIGGGLTIYGLVRFATGHKPVSVRELPVLVQKEAKKIAETVVSDRLAVPVKISRAQLIAPEHLPDAWKRFIKPIAFLGREADLDRLTQFADSDETFAWQTLYGAHGVGKSRLAKEWLLRLRERDAKWHVGFLPDDTKLKENVVANEPSGPVALVIDEAGRLGRDLWDIVAALHRNCGGHKVRILLLAHSDLTVTPSGNFARDELLKSLREHETLREARSNADIRAPMTRGIELSVMAIAEQAAGLRQSATQHGQALDDAQVRGLLKATEGRTAFLMLAGRHPDEWPKLLDDYATEIIENAKTAFGDGHDHALRLLMLSALIGPTDSAARERIAPKAWPPAKLAELFSVTDAEAAERVPALEPDLLSHAVFFKAFAQMPAGVANATCLEIARYSPERFLEKSMRIWERRGDAAQMANVLTGKVTRETEVARALEAIFAAAGETSPRSIHAPFGELSRTRGKLMLHALLAADAGHAAIVDAALRYLPRDASSNYLPDIHQVSACTAATRDVWAALLHYYLAPTGAPVPDAIEHLALGRFESTETSELLAHLRMGTAFQKATAAIRVAEVLRDRRVPPSEIIKPLEPYLKAFDAMLQSGLDAHVATSAFALSWVACEHDGKPGQQFLTAQNSANLVSVIAGGSRRPQSLSGASRALGNAWRFPVDRMTLLPGGEGPTERSLATEEVNERNSAGDALVHCLDDASLRLDAQISLALASLRIDRLPPTAVAPLIAHLTTPGMPFPDRLEILNRVALSGGSAAGDLLHGVIASKEPGGDIRTLSLCAMAKVAGADKLRALQRNGIGTELGYDIDALVQEAGNRDRPETKKLSDDARRIITKNSGNLIHKLKAKNSTGQWAYYFVLVEPDKELAFLTAIKGEGTVDLETYGRVITSCYGEQPTAEVKQFLKDQYDFDV